MSKNSVKKVVKRLGSLLLLVAGLSVFGDERPQERTVVVADPAEVRVTAPVKVRDGAELRGTVVRVARNGDSFLLRTGRDVVEVEAKGGVKAWYNGAAYRVRDLERGDEVAVELRKSKRGYRAREVHVLRSVSHDRRAVYDLGNRRSGDDWYDRYDRRDRYDRYERLEGFVADVDRRRERMTVKVSFFRSIEVDLRDLESRGDRREIQALRSGDRIVLDGRYDRGVFVAYEIADVRRR